MKLEKNKCPTCKKPAFQKDNKWFPFCSERCKKVDLGKWFLGEYSIAGEKVKDPNNEEE